MNIQIVSHNVYGNLEVKLKNVYKAKHPDVVLPDEKDINRMMYDIYTTGNSKNVIENIMMIRDESEDQGNIYIVYNTEEINKSKLRQMLSPLSDTEKQIWKKTLLSTVAEVQDMYSGRRLVISITNRLQKKLVSRIKEEIHFNKQIYQHTLMSETEDDSMDTTPPKDIKNTEEKQPKHIQGFTCHIFSTQKFEMPTLKHLCMIYIHRNLKSSQQICMNTAQVDYTEHPRALATLGLPQQMEIDLQSWYLSCPMHFELTGIVNNTAMHQKRYFIREGSELQQRMKQEAILHPEIEFPEDWLLTKQEIIHIQIITLFGKTLPPGEATRICNQGVGEAELYDFH